VFQKFLDAGAVGDFLFAPVGPGGFLTGPDDFRLMSLLEQPDDLPQWISRGTEVLAVVGPCGECGDPKTEVLESLLSLPREARLNTHLITDLRSAQQILRS
jgi:hypothetical protein